MSGANTSWGYAQLTNTWIDSVLQGTRWIGQYITYSFPDSYLDYQTSYPNDFQQYQRINSNQVAAAFFALEGWSATRGYAGAGFSVEGFTNLSVSFAGWGSGAGTIRLLNSTDYSHNIIKTAFAELPGGKVDSGDVFFETTGLTPVAGNFDWMTVHHELGHALGLKHPHHPNLWGYGAAASGSPYHSLEYTVMTYKAHAALSDQVIGQSMPVEQWGSPQTFMMGDIYALQQLYGADYTTNAGNTTYSWTPGSGITSVNGVPAITPGANRIFMTVWDGGGVDTYDLSAYAYTANMFIDLRPGNHSRFSDFQRADLNVNSSDVRFNASGNVYNAYLYGGDGRSLIENAIGGSGNDTLIGNWGANTLEGRLGDDTLWGLWGDDALYGGLGADQMHGGPGNDKYFVESAGDKVFENAGEGYDGVWSSLSFWLTDTVEYLVLTGNDPIYGVGSSQDNRIWGNAASNRMWGQAGNDLLVGGGGNDELAGGEGDDTLYGQQGADRLWGGAGSDTFVFDGLAEVAQGSVYDVVLDFVRGVDHLSFAAFDANTLVAGAQDFVYIGAQWFSGAGQLRFGGGYVSGDVNGDRVADFFIAVNGVTHLSASDFYV